MIDNYLLEYLVAFAHNGTVAGVAEELNVTTSSISRGLKKLENLLGVELFDRQPQKITLTAVGQFAAQRAEVLLNQHRDFNQAVINFAKQTQSLKVGAAIPGPLLLLAASAHDPVSSQVTIDHHLLTSPADWRKALIDHHDDLLFTTSELQSSATESVYLGQEQLAIKITKYNRLFNHRTVNFSELNGHEFVLSSHIGQWRPLIEQEVPHGQFLYQSQANALRELIRYSNFPIFKTNLTDYLDRLAHRKNYRQRKLIPISDAAAKMEVYGTYLSTNRHKLRPLIHQLVKLFQPVPIF